MTHTVTWKVWTLHNVDRVKSVHSGTLPERTYENEALCIKHLHDNEKGIEDLVLRYGNLYICLCR